MRRRIVSRAVDIDLVVWEGQQRAARIVREADARLASLRQRERLVRRVASAASWLV